jgi:hypothetical protein
MRRKRIAGKRQYKELTRSQKWQLLTSFPSYGPDSPFKSEEERREAWIDHRDELLAKCWGGRRPGAFWHYDRPDIDSQRIKDEEDVQLLYRMNMLTEVDIEQLKERGHYPPKPADGRDIREVLEDYAK